MDKQPEALRLAQQLEAGDIHECAWQAAAELRRLYDLSQRAGDSIEELLARIAALETALGMAVEALEATKWDGSPSFIKAALITARQTLGGKL